MKPCNYPEFGLISQAYKQLTELLDLQWSVIGDICRIGPGTADNCSSWEVFIVMVCLTGFVNAETIVI
jgi:hypothetical protein